jgi:iron complex outermembrane receptor protein
LGWGGINNNSPTYGGRVSVAASGSLIGLATGERQLINRSMGGSIVPGDYRQFDIAGAGTDPSRFNFRDFTPAIPAVEKAMYYVTGRYKIFGEGLQLYGDIMYSKTKQDNGLAASPFAVSGTVVDPVLGRIASSPYSPFGRFLTNIRYRTVEELGLRKSFFDNDYYRYVAGVNGDFNIKDNGFISRFGYDTGFVYERFDELRIDSGDAQFTPLFAEIQAGNFNPFIGVGGPVAGTANIYTTDPVTGASIPAGTQSYDNRAAALRAAYLGHSEFYERDFLYDAKVNMHLFPNLWNGGIDLAVGYEHRNIHQHSVPDPVQANGDQLGFNQAPNTKTTQEVNSVFTELVVPLVTSTMNVPFVRSLELSMAWRYEKFDDRDDYQKLTGSFDNVNQSENFGGTPRVSLRYQPIADVTLRASWGQSFRSPSPSSLFDPVSQNFPVLFDPVVGVTLQPPEGVWQGGNVNLKPEKSDSYSAGVVWTPKFLPGFTMTVDWYQIFTTDLILSPASNAQVLLTNGVIDPDGFGNGSGSIDGPGGPADGITRTDTGALSAVDADFGNAGKRNVEGLDVTAVYEIPTDRFGKFTLSGGWNHFFIWKAQPGVGPFSSFLGNYNNGTLPLAPGAIPWNKGFLRGEWEWRHFDFVATGNYIGDFRDDPAFFRTFVGVRTVPSYITLDMQLSYEWVKPAVEPAPTYAKDAKDSKNVMTTEAASSTIWQRMLWGTKLTVGVVDAFDRQPPSVLGAFNDNYDTSLYSIRNRFWYVSMNKKF